MKKIFAVLLSLTMLVSMTTSSFASNTISVNKTAEDTEAALAGAKFDVYGNSVDVSFGGGEMKEVATSDNEYKLAFSGGKLKDVMTADNEYELAFSGGEVVTLQDNSTVRQFRFLTLADVENSDMGLALNVNGENAAPEIYKGIQYSVTYNYGDGFVAGGAWDGFVKPIVANDGTLSLEVKGSCVAQLTATYGDATDSVVIVIPGDMNGDGFINPNDGSLITGMTNIAGDGTYHYEMADMNGNGILEPDNTDGTDLKIIFNMMGGVLPTNGSDNPNSPYTAPVEFTTGDATPTTEKVRTFVFLKLADVEDSDMGLDLTINGEAAAADVYKNVQYSVTYNYGEGFVEGGVWDGFVKPIVADDGTLTLEVKGSCVAQLTATYGDATDSVVIVIPGDVNYNNTVNGSDSSIIINHIGQAYDGAYTFILMDMNGSGVIDDDDASIALKMGLAMLPTNGSDNPDSPYTAPVAFTTGDATPETEEVRLFVFLRLADVEDSDMSLALKINDKDATADMYKAMTLDVKYNYEEDFVAGGAWNGFITPAIDDDGVVMTLAVKGSCVAKLTASYTYNGLSDEDSVIIVIPGDIDRNGALNGSDTSIIRQYIGIGNENVAEANYAFAYQMMDLDGDEIINAYDSSVIHQMIATVIPTNESSNPNSPYTSPVATTVGTEEIEAYSVLIASGVTNENGSYTFEDLPYDGSYKLVETEAPDGYQTVGPIMVDTSNGNASEDIEDPLADTIDVTYPEAGTDENGDNVPDDVTEAVEVGKSITVDPADGTWRDSSDPTELEAEEDITLEDPTAPEGKTFIGWTSTDDGEGNKTYTAQYEDDANDDDIPDKYQAEVTFTATDGTFEDGTTTKTEIVTLVDEDGKWSEDGSATIDEAPAVTPDENFKDGSWDKEFPLTVTGDTEAEYTATALGDVNVTYKENGKDENNDNIPDTTTSPIEEGKTLTVDPGDGTWRETSDPTEITAGTDDIDVEDPTAPEEKVFTGWTETEDEDGNKTLTAQYEDDANDDGIPDKYQAEVTFTATDATFEDGTTTKTETVTLVDEDGKWSETGSAVIEEAPAVTPDENFKDGSWDKEFPLTVTEDTTAEYTATAINSVNVTYKENGKDENNDNIPDETTSPLEEGKTLTVDPGDGTWRETSDPTEITAGTDDIDVEDPTAPEGKIFTGWTETEDEDGNKTLTAQYEDDANDDGIPDKYQAEVTFTAKDATFDDDSTTKTETVTLVDENGKWSEDGSAVIDEAPAVTPDEDFKEGSWNEEFPLTVTGDTEVTYTAKALGEADVTYKEAGKDENNDNIPDETTTPLKEGNTLTVDPGDGTWRETSDPTEITAGTDDIDVEDPTAPEEKVFTGWTETEDEDGNKTLTAQYEDDKDADGVPDKYQTEITFKAKDGKFDDGTTTKKQTVTLVDVNGKWSEKGFAVIGEAPVVTPNNGYVPGTWDKPFPLIVTKKVTATYTAIARADTDALITYDTDGKGTTENKIINKAEEILIKPNGGTYEGSTEDQYRTITTDITLTNPIRQGYIFAGWTVEETQVPVTKFDFNRDGVINETDLTILEQLVSGSITPIIFDEINFYHYLFNVGYETGTDNRMFDDNDISAITRQINKLEKSYTANMPASLMRFFSNYPNPIESAQAHRVIYTFTANWAEEPPIYKIETSDHVAYMIGYPDGTFNPNGSITRAEVATVLFRMLTDNVRNSNMTISNAFTDVPYEHWANKAISTLAKLGILDITSGDFRPDDPITRGELASIFANSKLTGTQEYTISFSDVVTNTRENKNIMACAKLGLFKGYPDGTFRADSNMTRAEFAAGILRVLNRANEQDSCEYITNGLVNFSDIDSTAWYYMSVIEITNSHIAKYINDVEKEWTKLNQTPDWATYEK